MKNIILLLSVVLLFGCAENKTNTSTKVVTVGTTGMIGDALLNIAGDKIEITSLMGPGVDPHLYKVTQGDLQKLQNADIIFYNGIHLEGKMSEILEKLAKKKNVVAFGEGVSTSKLRLLDEENKIYDPHIWFNVALWKETVNFASSALQRADTLNLAFYKQNTLEYTSKLDSLHLWVQEEIRKIPVESRLLITAHDAFGYFGDAYGIEVNALQGISTVSDYGLNEVNALVNLITKRKIKAIFIETSVSEKSINAVIEGCKAKGHNVIIGGTLYSDAMGNPGTEEGTYIGMVKANVNTITNALK